MSSAKKLFLKPSFVVCAALLLTAAVSKEAVIRVFGIHMTKLPIPLQHSLDELSEAALLPYAVRDKSKIQNRDVVESLGTEEYLQWILEDPQAAPGSPTRYCSVFITYYTGNPDMVPHVPDECYIGAGNVLLNTQTLTIEVPREPDPQNVSFQYILFSRTDKNTLREDKFSVQYLFHVNGRYGGSRTDTRLALGSNWRSKYSYFSKVEWNFFGKDGFNATVYPDKEQTLEASEKMLAVLLPELERNHWPDWQAVNEQPKPENNDNPPVKN